MPLQLPSFLRRRLRLYEARRALLAGSPEEALERLSDSSLALSDGAERLREKVLDVLCREAARRASAGADRSALRLFDLVAAQDPERARTWRKRVADDRASREASSQPDSRAASESGIRSALETLLAEMRRKRSSREGSPPPASAATRAEEVSTLGPVGVGPVGVGPAQTVATSACGTVIRFHLAVDDAGEYLVASGAEILLGHARAGHADLPFLADLDGRHATLRHSESFHAGPGWQLAPVGRQRIEIGGRPLGAEGSRLGDGDLVRLSPHLSFVFRTPEPGSGSALLELLHGAECDGAGRILLLQPGSAGALRFGGRPDRLVQVRGLRQEIRLVLESRELELSSSAGLVVSGTSTGASEGTDASRAPHQVRVACPPATRVDFMLSRSAAGRPPFGFSIRPVDVRKGASK